MIFFSHSSRIRILQLTLASLLGVGGGGGGGSNTPIGASCYRNRVKLRPLGLHLFFLTSSCLANGKSFLTNKGKLKTNPGGIVACSVAHMCSYFVTADTFSLVKRWLRLSYYWTTFHHYLGAWNRLADCMLSDQLSSDWLASWLTVWQTNRPTYHLLTNCLTC